jgi:hypothetical protein
MILTVLFPSIYCKETVLLAGHTLALVGKTFLSIYIANLDGSIVKALVDRKGKTFVKRRKHLFLNLKLRNSWIVRIQKIKKKVGY